MHLDTRRSLSTVQNQFVQDQLVTPPTAYAPFGGHCSDCDVTRDMLRSVVNGQFVDAAVINAYAHMLIDRGCASDGASVIYIHTQFPYCLTRANKSLSLSSWTAKQVSLFSKDNISSADFILSPICTDSHWVLGICNLQKKLFGCLSSIPSAIYSAPVREFHGWLKEHFKNVLGVDASDWSEDYRLECPSQEDTVNCAICVMKLIACVMAGESFNFTAADTQLYRGQMTYELLDWLSRT